MAQYATQAQLEAYLGTAAPGDADRLLKRASDLLDANLLSWRYNTDVNGYPTDQVVLDAFADAVCAQVEWWLATQDELGQMERLETVAFEGYTQSRGGYSTDRMAPRARERLRLVPEVNLSHGVLA